MSKFIERCLAIPCKIEIDFKDDKDLRKQFYRHAAKEIAKHLLSNGYIDVMENRDIYSNSLILTFIARPLQKERVLPE